MENLRNVSRRNTIIIAVVLLVSVLIFVVLFNLAYKKSNFSNFSNSKSISLGESLKKELENKFGKNYIVKNSEKYEEYEKITIDLSKLEIIPTPKAEAVIFVKDGKIVPMPESYAKAVIAKDLEEVNKKGDDPIDGTLESSKYFEEFSGFNNGTTYKKVYINSIKLDSPAKKESNMIPGDLNYNIIVVDEYGNVLFRTLSDKAY